MLGKLVRNYYIINICWLIAWVCSQPPNDIKVVELTYKNHSCNITLHRNKRSLAVKGQQWENRVVPYTISEKFNQTQQQMIIDTMRMLEEDVSGIVQFRPRTWIDGIFLYIQPGNECSSTIGQESQSVMNLAESCFSTGTLLHELMHVLGFDHEQNRPDRDEYVCVFENNIQSGEEGNFKKRSPESSETFDLPYDYSSIMQYPPFIFNKDPLWPSIVPKNNTSAKIDRRNSLSPIDKQAVIRFYETIPKQNWLFRLHPNFILIFLLLICMISIGFYCHIDAILDYWWPARVKPKHPNENEHVALEMVAYDKLNHDKPDDIL